MATLIRITLQRMISKSESEYIVSKKQGWEYRQTFWAIIIEQAIDTCTQKNRLKEIRKRQGRCNQWRIPKIVSGNKLGAAVIAVEVKKAGEAVKINE